MDGGDLNLNTEIQQMTSVLAHRGPDASGEWVDAEAGVAFGHRRLAIVDLSSTGAQPMKSSSGRYVITYNGEVYNTAELRAELEAKGHVFRGTSDTEVIVEGCAEWGVDTTVRKLVGMFAFGLWDAKLRELVVVRDRLGIKPLYWSYDKGTFLFGSELKAFRTHPDFVGEIDRDALAQYMRDGYVAAPRSIYRGVSKLVPGSCLRVGWGLDPKISTYWSLADVASVGRDSRLTGTDDEVIDQLEALLSDAVERRMVADVPLGAFLSGGIDSSLVVALMQRASATPIQTFSIGFNEPGFDEAVHAGAVANHLGTEHTEHYVSSSEARDVIPQLPSIYDEPFADVSQIPTYLVSKLARNSVTVCLSGDGGDELFAGYTRYGQAQTLARLRQYLPQGMRSLAGSAMQSVPIIAWDAILKSMPGVEKRGITGDRIHKLAPLFTADKWGANLGLMSQWPGAGALVNGVSASGDGLAQPKPDDEHGDLVSQLQFADMATYLPDDILTKVDRATMAVSLEGRVPIIDHRVVEFAARLPMGLKVRNGETKWLLRQVLCRHVPASLVERPKMGFGVPVGDWLRGPLRDWADDQLGASGDGDLLDGAAINRMWADHLSGRRNWHAILWNVLMFRGWQQETAV